MVNSDAAVIVAASSATYNIVLQVLMRILSFISNAILIRLVTKDVLGIINVRLMLLYTTTHCLSREAVRRSCPSSVDQFKKKNVLNLLWLPLPVSLLTGTLTAMLWLYFLEVPNENTILNYHYGVKAVVISVCVETLAEPLYLLGQNFNFVKLKVIIEGIWHSSKIFFMVVLTWLWPQSIMFNFCCCQVVASIIYTSLYYGYFIRYLRSTETVQSNFPLKSIYDIRPYWQHSGEMIDRSYLILTMKFYKQTFFKQLLTEGERYIMTIFKLLSFKEQGVFDAISNLGAMAARLLFLPIEDSSYLLFSRLSKRGHSENQKDLEASKKALQFLTKLMLVIGLTISVFGHSYSHLLLSIYGGQKFTDDLAVSLLQWQCFSIFFIATNGITECFLQATMSSQEIDSFSKKLLLFSVIFLSLSYFFVQIFGSTGFVFANCLNMICRIINSLLYIKKFFRWNTNYLFEILTPHTNVLFAYMLCFICISASENYLYKSSSSLFQLLHVVLGVSSLLFILKMIHYYEKDLVYFVINLFYKKKAID